MQVNLGVFGNFFLPNTIDIGAVAVVVAVIVNIILASVFALQHSIMARPAFKKGWMKIRPAEIERSTIY